MNGRTKEMAEKHSKSIDAIKDVHSAVEAAIDGAAGVFEVAHLDRWKSQLADLHDKAVCLDELISTDGDFGGQRTARLESYLDEARQLMIKIGGGK